MTPDRLKLAQNFASTPEGRAFKEYLEERLLELDKVSDLAKDETFANRALGRAEAASLLRSIVSFLHERKDTPQAKNQFI